MSHPPPSSSKEHSPRAAFKQHLSQIYENEHLFRCFEEQHCLSREQSALQSAFLEFSLPAYSGKMTSAGPRCTQAAPSHEPSSTPRGCAELRSSRWNLRSVSLLSSQPRTGLLLRGQNISATESCEHMSSTNSSSAKEHELLTVG